MDYLLSLKINNMKQEEILQQVKDGRLSIEEASTLLKGIEALGTRPLIFLAKSAMDFQKSSMVKEKTLSN